MDEPKPAQAPQTAAAPPAPAPGPAEPAAPAPYGIGSMLEDSVTAPFRAPAAFAALAGRPAPSYGVMMPNLLAFCAVACAVNLVLRSAAPLPGLPPASPGLLAVVAAAALILAAPLSFVAAGALHAFMLLSGGEGDFQRSYQTASLLSVVVVLQAMLNWSGWAWALPSLLAAYLAAVAARSLHRAPLARAAAVFGLLAAVSVAGQWWVRAQVARFSQAFAAARELGRQVQQIQQMPLALDAGQGAPALQAAPGPQAAETPAATGGPAGPAAPAAPVSGLDLLYGPPSGGSPAINPNQIQAQTQLFQQAAANMLGPAMGLLNNPALTRNMSPEQAKQMQALTGMIGDMQKSMASGKNLSPQERDAMARKLQGTMGQLMNQMQSPTAGRPRGQPRSEPAARSAPAPAAPETKLPVVAPSR